MKWGCYFWDSLALIIIFFSGTFGTYKWPHFVTLHSGSVTFGILLKVATINYLRALILKWLPLKTSGLVEFIFDPLHNGHLGDRR